MDEPFTWSIFCGSDRFYDLWFSLLVFRAAQKLSLSRRKKSHPGPSSPPAEAPGPPLLYTGGFSGALQLSPPSIPPCLLRAGSKVKDTPGMGKVWCFFVPDGGPGGGVWCVSG